MEIHLGKLVQQSLLSSPPPPHPLTWPNNIFIIPARCHLYLRLWHLNILPDSSHAGIVNEVNHNNRPQHTTHIHTRMCECTATIRRTLFTAGSFKKKKEIRRNVKDDFELLEHEHERSNEFIWKILNGPRVSAFRTLCIRSVRSSSTFFCERPHTPSVHPTLRVHEHRTWYTANARTVEATYEKCTSVFRQFFFLVAVQVATQKCALGRA